MGSKQISSLVGFGTLLHCACRWFLIEFLELTHLIQLEVVVVFSLLQIGRVLVLGVTGVQTLLLSLKLDSIMLIGLLLLLSKQQIHGQFQLVNLIDRHFGLGSLLLVLARALSLSVRLVGVVVSCQLIDSIGKEVRSRLRLVSAFVA